MVDLFVVAQTFGPLLEMVPQFGQMVQEIVFGEIWANPALETRLCSFITMSALSSSTASLSYVCISEMPGYYK